MIGHTMSLDWFRAHRLPTPWPAAPNPRVSRIATRADHPDLSPLQKHGVVLVRQAFSQAMAERARESVEQVVRRAVRDSWVGTTNPGFPGITVLGDLLSIEEIRDLDYFVLHPPFIEMARRILGEEVVYFGDSSIRTGFGGRGFHKDFQEETDPPIRMLRFAFYLQAHDRYSGGLKIRLGSHRRVSRHVGPMMNVPSLPGDLVIFDLRTSHTGDNLRLRYLPWLCLHPKVENLVPHQLALPEERHRMVVLWTYSAAGSHIDSYLEWITRDRSHWVRTAWNQRHFDMARARGLILRPGTEDQGSLIGSRPTPSASATRLM
jgi:hypothetical protein